LLSVSAATTLILSLFILLGAGFSIAISMLGVGLIGIEAFTSAPLGSVMATSVWSSVTTWTLSSLPLFVWMGEILFRTRLSEDMFDGLAPWLGWLPGGLLHVNNVGCAIFAAVSGSSAVTAATIGRISLPELHVRKYPEKMAIATLAGSATLGFLIPPSIPMIVYGAGAEQSIARLFIAGIVPGMMVLGIFMAYTIGWSLLHRSTMPEAILRVPFLQRVRRLRRLGPILLLIAGVIGSIYFGYATPTESAAIGVLGALILSAATGTLTWASFIDSVIAATRTTCMIGFIIAAAAFLTVMLAYTKIPINLAAWIASLQLSPYALVLVLTVFYIILGCFLEGISIMVLSAAIIVPVVEKAGFDLIWFGVYLVLVIEMALITPPVGFNLFVIQSLTKRDMLYISRAAFPFFLLLLGATAVITIWPQIVLFLPNLMLNR
jgi:C4-dicarboxylate transporter, DctM subunit